LCQGYETKAEKCMKVVSLHWIWSFTPALIVGAQYVCVVSSDSIYFVSLGVQYSAPSGTNVRRDYCLFIVCVIDCHHIIFAFNF